MKYSLAALVVLSLPVALSAQTAALRPVRGDTLFSSAEPAATLIFDKAFRYAGGQVIDIFKVAGAEQHFFVDAAPDHGIRRFYWVQFEHYYPANTHTYDYSGIKQQPAKFGRLEFMGDVNTVANYFTDDNRPNSDSEAAERFLRTQGFTLAGTFMRYRLFHLPDTTRRRELMVIYGEFVPAGADQESMKAAITAHAQAGLTVR